MSTFDALLLILEGAVLLYLLWRVLDHAFAAIEQWQEALRERDDHDWHAEPARRLEESQSLKERES